MTFTSHLGRERERERNERHSNMLIFRFSQWHDVTPVYQKTMERVKISIYWRFSFSYNKNRIEKVHLTRFEFRRKSQLFSTEFLHGIDLGRLFLAIRGSRSGDSSIFFLLCVVQRQCIGSWRGKNSCWTPKKKRRSQHTAITEQNRQKDQTVQSTDDHQREIHAKVEDLKQLRFSKGEHHDTTDLRQCDSTEDLKERGSVTFDRRSTPESPYWTAHLWQGQARSFQSSVALTDGEVTRYVCAEFDCNPDWLNWEERSKNDRSSSSLFPYHDDVHHGDSVELNIPQVHHTEHVNNNHWYAENNQKWCVNIKAQ